VLCVGAGGSDRRRRCISPPRASARIGLVDFDVVDVSNLQRQIIHSTADVGRSKLESARARLNALNPEVSIETFDARLSASNALSLVQGFDIVLDGTDNFTARYLVNDACVLAGRPNAWGSIFRFEGQASVFSAAGGPCYRCLHPEPPPPGLVPSCAEAGVLGVLPGIIGTIQATEANQGDRRDRRAAHRTVPRLRRPADAFPRTAATEGSRLRDLWGPSDDHRAARIRRVL
jgi:adenylyltransferase/sulfurtransferase